MIINILLPYKEKFDIQKASSVSITVRNNLLHTNYLKNIKVFGQQTSEPLFKKNFVGIKYSLLSFKNKNNFLANEMIRHILSNKNEQQLIEVHNRPFLVNKIKKRINLYPISLFLHNNPKEMKGSKTLHERVSLLSNCSAVFCVSEYVKNEFIDGITENLHKVFVLYNGVERKLREFPAKKNEVLFVGRLVHEKGVELYVDVIKSVASKYPDWSFNLIGSTKLGETDDENSYAFKISQKFEKIGHQAKFYGFQNYDFVQNKMKDSSIIIIPSLWQEPFGMVVVEAMSNGIAIIASKVGGIPEILKDNGILINDINFLKLKKVLEDLLSKRNKMVQFQKKSWNNFTLTSKSSSQKLDKFRENILKKNF